MPAPYSYLKELGDQFHTSLIFYDILWRMDGLTPVYKYVYDI